MAFFESIVSSYTLKFDPPSPTGLWELPESALEAVCLPEERNNAMFIAEPPTYNRSAATDARNIFSPEPHIVEQMFGNEDSEIVAHLDTPSLWFPFNGDESGRKLIRNESHNQMSSSHGCSSGDVDGIPHHLLVQLGLAKPREIPRDTGRSRMHLGNDNVPIAKDKRQDYSSKGNVFSTASVMYENRNLRPLELNEIFTVSPTTQNRGQISENDPPSLNFEESHDSLSQLFLSEEFADENVGATCSLDREKRTKPEIFELQDSKRTNYENESRTAGDSKTDKNVKSKSVVCESRNSCGETLEKSCDTSQVEEDSKHLESQSSLSQLFQSQEFEVSHYRDIMRCYGGPLSIDCGSKGLSKDGRQLRVDDAHTDPDGVQIGTDDVQNDPSDVQNASDGVQNDSDDVQSDSDDVQNDSDGVENESNAVQNDPDDFASGHGKLSCDRVLGDEELTTNTNMNVQPFVIRGCEPKMFDISIKRKEDNPWKSEVRQGVLEPAEEVSNRDQREMEEIPMVVSPYFPNESNHPVQEDKRTSLFDLSHDPQAVSSSHDPLIINSSQNPMIVSSSSYCDATKDVHRKIYQQEATDELKLCKDFFRRSSNETRHCDTKKPKLLKKDKNLEKCRKITNYFAVIKHVSEQGTQCEDRKIDNKRSKTCGEREIMLNKCKRNFTTNKEANNKVKSIFHDSNDIRSYLAKREIDFAELKCNVGNSSSKRSRSEREFPELSSSFWGDSRKFEDLGAGCIQYGMPSKQMFRDLPPGSVQSISELKPAGFDRGKAASIAFVGSSKSPNLVEMPSDQAKIIDFHRAGVGNGHCNREFRILQEDKVEETTLEMESSGELFEIGFTLCYKEKYSVLNRPEGVESKLHHPAGVMSRVEFAGGKTITTYQSVDELMQENSRSFLLCLLESNCRKVCFEAQAFIMFVLEITKENDDRICHDWLLLDPIVGMWLLNPDFPPHSFNCVMKEFNIKVDGGRNHPPKDWKYAVRDFLDAQSKAVEQLHAKLTSCRLWDVFFSLETPLTPILASMERRSIEVNSEQLKDISKALQGKLNSLEKSAWELLGKKFQLSSPLQLRTILYDELKLDEKTKVKVKCTANSGAKSTDEGTLKLLLGSHPLPALILEYRHAHKIKSTYIDGILAHVVNKKSVSTTWEQCAAATGRITSSGPNLQSIPKQEEDLMSGEGCFNLRKTFVSRLKYTFVAVDFQQIELRVFAHLSQDESLLSAFQETGDIFQTMTKIRIGKEEFDHSEREKTKTLTYALLYGAGAHKISELLTVDIDHASQICSDFYRSFPGLKRFRSRTLEECRQRKELRSLSGRRRLFPNICCPDPQEKRYTERQALNFVIQGSAADICKAAMLRAEAALKGRSLQANLLLQIHDELLWEVSEEHAKCATETIKKAIENTKDYWINKFSLKINLPVKIKSGNTWGNMKPANSS